MRSGASSARTVYHWDYYGRAGIRPASLRRDAFLRVQSLANISLGFADPKPKGMCLLLGSNEK